MIIKTISDKKNLSYRDFFKNTMHIVERRLNMTISGKPQ